MKNLYFFIFLTAFIIGCNNPSQQKMNQDMDRMLWEIESTTGSNETYKDYLNIDDYSELDKNSRHVISADVEFDYSLDGENCNLVKTKKGWFLETSSEDSCLVYLYDDSPLEYGGERELYERFIYYLK